MRLIFFLLLIVSVSQAKVEIRTDVASLQNNIRAEAQETIEKYLGKDASSVISVKLIPSMLVVENKELLDTGYLPFPTKINNFPKNTDAELLEIERLDIDVRVSEQVSGDDVTNLKSILESQFSVYKPKVIVTNIKFPDKSKLREPASVKPEDEKGFFEKYEAQIKYALFILALICGLVGLFILTGGLKSGLSNLAEGVRTLKQSTIGFKSSEDSALKLDTTKSGDLDEEEEYDVPQFAPSSSVPPKDREHEMNLQALKKLIDEDPVLVTQSLHDSEFDGLGLRWLLPQISSEERDSLRQTLGAKRVHQYSQIEGVMNFDCSLWLQDLVQRISLLKFKGGGLLDKALTPAERLQISKVSIENLLKLALKNSTPSFWRLALELAGEDEFKNISIQLGDTEWEHVLKSKLITIEQFKLDFAKFKDLLNVKSSSSEDVESNVGEKLEGATLELVRNKPIGEDELFIDLVAKSDPVLADNLRTKVWSMNHLQNVPESYLRGLFTAYDIETLFAIIVSFPEEIQTSLLKMVPHGNKLIMVEDLLSKAKEQSTETEQKAALIIARKFLDELKERHGKGEFKLSSESEAA